MKIEITDEIYADALDFASSVATEVCKQNGIDLEKDCEDSETSVFDKVREAVLEKVIDVTENVVEHL
jgi:hypothetical protein